MLGSERQLLRNQNEDDHLIIAFDQSGAQAGFPNLFCELFIFLNFDVVEKLFFYEQIKYLKSHRFLIERSSYCSSKKNCTDVSTQNVEY